MAPPLDSKQLDILNKEFYVNKNLFGRDKLYQIIKVNMKIQHHQEDKSQNC